ncbi:MAG: C69 family dipeptidase [Clostridia bacterium]
MKKTRFTLFIILILTLLFATQGALACTIFAVGKDASTDRSTIISHNDDSTSADFRLWIIPEMAGGPGVMRDLALDSHNYGDYGNFPEVKDYGSGYAVGQIEQPKDTYSYLHSRYSFINEKGVAMSESTFGFDLRGNEQGKKVHEIIYGSNLGLIDCWNAQDIALERASTAREAVEIMGDLIDTYGWSDLGETMSICDGEEVWIFEAYGAGLWCAVRMPADCFFVAANFARINFIDFEDSENYLYSENIRSFAVDNGLWSELSGEPFEPNRIYSPETPTPYSQRREWRGITLAAPSLLASLTPDQESYPLFVKPDKKLSVQDIFEFSGDYYAGTDYDVTRSGFAGDFGNPLNGYNAERTINVRNTCYLQIGSIKGWLPDEAKCLVWYGYGAPHSSFLTPLWASQTALPALYRTGNRYEKFARDSGWWINSYVQQTATINYDYAIKAINASRQERMGAQYDYVALLQEQAGAMIQGGNTDAAVKLLTDYACANAQSWYDLWLDLGDELLGDLMWGYVGYSRPEMSEWYHGMVENAGQKPLDQDKSVEIEAWED